MRRVHAFKTVKISSLRKKNITPPHHGLQATTRIHKNSCIYQKSVNDGASCLYQTEKKYHHTRWEAIGSGNNGSCGIPETAYVMNSLMMVTKPLHLLVQDTIYQVMLLLMQTLLRARQQPMRNLLIQIDASEKYPHDKNRETREKASQHNI